jgi:hypothetical protein
MPDAFLHERSDFKALVETVADGQKINDPLHAVFGRPGLVLRGLESLPVAFSKRSESRA